MVKRQFKRFSPFEDHEDARTQYLQTNRASVAKQNTVPLAALNRSTPPVLHRVEQDTVPLAAFHGLTPPVLHKVEQETMPLAAVHGAPAVPHKRGNLSMAVQRMINAGLARLQDPQPEGLFTRGLQAVKSGTNVLGLLPILMLTSTSGLLIVSFAYYISPYGDLTFEFFFFLGLLLIFVPNVVRLMSPATSRLERICLLCVIGTCFYLVQLMVSPLRVSSFDEFLHWRTVDDILRTRHLFSVNSMLPVSPYYPGLEIVTNAVSTTSGLSTFHAGIIVMSAARLLMILSLFMLYEQVTNSSRMAGIATIIYMTNPHFLLFDAYFNYETLALPLATFMLYILARYQTMNEDYRWAIFIAWIVLLAVTITHHMTDYVFDGLLILWAVISLFQASSSNMRRNLVTIALFGALLSLAYTFLLQGNPAWGYLSEYFGAAFNQLGHIIAGTNTPRPLFVGPAGQSAPIWDRLLMLASVALVAFGLPFGLLSLWQQHRHYALAVTFGIASLAYPISQAFRFTSFGGEITDRSAAFLFLPIAYVLTILITHFWPTRKLSWRGTSLIICAISVMFLGGVILEAGPVWSNLPGSYMVVADVRSIEPEGIQDATWALTYLRSNNRVATDRINQSLMNTYGDQRIVTSQEDKVEVSPVFFSSHFGPAEVAILRQARVRYLVVDLRLSTALPLEGYYFEENEPGFLQLISPISRNALTKFNVIPQINRVFDSGDIVIYDVGALVDGSGP